MQNQEEISPEDKSEIRKALVSLINSLQARKGVGTSGIIPDEEIVLTSLQHPERGDVVITALRDSRGRLQMFISNRRDQDSPFAVMSGRDVRNFPERRLLNSRPTSSLKEDEFALFLITLHDKEALQAPLTNKWKIFSTHFSLNETEAHKPKIGDDLKVKPLSACTLEEKLQIIKRNWPGDSRRDALEKELYGFSFNYSKYKMPERSEEILLSPDHYRERVAQFIRDMYPYGIRTTVRRDYPKEHKQRLDDVHAALKRLSDLTVARQKSDAPAELARHYEEITAYLREIVERDPELSHFV
jgi:hypothetical protein